METKAKPKPMTPLRALRLLQGIAQYSDTERAHSEADDIICDLLIALGHEDVVDAYVKIDKWHA